MAEYRKRHNRDTWHFCKNCNNWPKSGYKSRATKPSSGELCNECLSKQKNRKCN